MAVISGVRRLNVTKQEALRSKGLFKIAPPSKVPRRSTGSGDGINYGRVAVVCVGRGWCVFSAATLMLMMSMARPVRFCDVASKFSLFFALDTRANATNRCPWQVTVEDQCLALIARKCCATENGIHGGLTAHVQGWARTAVRFAFGSCCARRLTF